MKIFDRTGKMALGSRLRQMAAQVTDDAAQIYALYGVAFTPKWFPVFFVLSEGGEMTITEIAEQIGHSQPSVTKIVKEMALAGWVDNGLGTTDKRKNVVGLTESGKQLAERMLSTQCVDIEIAIDDIIAEAAHNLWDALAEWELLLAQKSLFRRVMEQKKLRESRDIQIVPYNAAYQAAFRALNEEWISTYFEMEEADYKALDNPDGYILDKGGEILVALYQGEPLGVCALIKMDHPDYDYELAKMAVSPRAQGKNMGWLLGQAVIATAKELGASKLFLESNTLLQPAISLYYKLGFQRIEGPPSPYKRANIQMELALTK